ncbi:uncharacterized protein K441DRAFT_652609, partial [Cenococcum geophilum 1.58]|uniref:uncharacterized protein n=1 Tax=Cenococcum geophilum 1.58 TaxID=794803 RepID=UPI00358E9414
MGRRLPDKVVYRIRIRIKANKAVLAITEAVKVGKKIIYKIRLNLNIWGEPYAPPTKLLNFLKDQPTAYIDKMQAFLFN